MMPAGVTRTGMRRTGVSASVTRAIALPDCNALHYTTGQGKQKGVGGVLRTPRRPEVKTLS